MKPVYRAILDLLPSIPSNMAATIFAPDFCIVRCIVIHCHTWHGYSYGMDPWIYPQCGYQTYAIPRIYPLIRICDLIQLKLYFMMMTLVHILYVHLIKARFWFNNL